MEKSHFQTRREDRKVGEQGNTLMDTTDDKEERKKDGKDKWGKN